MKSKKAKKFKRMIRDHKLKNTQKPLIIPEVDFNHFINAVDRGNNEMGRLELVDKGKQSVFQIGQDKLQIDMTQPMNRFLQGVADYCHEHNLSAEINQAIGVRQHALMKLIVKKDPRIAPYVKYYNDGSMQPHNVVNYAASAAPVTIERGMNKFDDRFFDILESMWEKYGRKRNE